MIWRCADLKIKKMTTPYRVRSFESIVLSLLGNVHLTLDLRLRTLDLEKCIK